MPLKLMTRGEKTGRCNICGTYGPLTEDHTPPKGCVIPRALELQHVAHRLDAQHAIKAKANDGVKYRTLCARCNNALLGGRYDPALIEFVKRVDALLTSIVVVPNTVAVPAKPALLVRAVWGHLAAVGVDRYLKGPRTEELRDFFLDETLPIPAGIAFHYWIYPYRRQVLIRDAALGDLRERTQTLFWAMKFYPMAFAIWQPARGAGKMGMRDLATYCGGHPDNVVDLIVDLHPVPHELTLEAPTETQVILLGRDAIVANGRVPRGQLLKLPNYTTSI